MAVKVGHLRVILLANANRFKRTMRSARKTVGGFVRKLSGMRINLGRLSAAFTAIAGVGLLGFARSLIRTNDHLAKTADKLGITTEALASLRLAGELTGVANRKLEMGIQRMTRRISEAAIGTGEAQDAIKELGLSAESLNKLSPDEAFREIARAMKAVKNQSDRVRLSFKLFDSEGVDLVNTLALGSKGLDEIREKAERFGLAVSRIDAAQFENLEDSITELNARFRGLGNNLLLTFIPTLNKVLAGFEKIASGSLKSGQSVVDAFAMMSEAETVQSIQQQHNTMRRLVKMQLWWARLNEKISFGTPGRTIPRAIPMDVQHLERLLDEIDREEDFQLDELRRRFDDISGGAQGRGKQKERFNKLLGIVTGRSGSLSGGAALRAGSILGNQQVRDRRAHLKPLEETAKNTKESSISLKELVGLMRGEGVPLVNMN